MYVCWGGRTACAKSLMLKAVYEFSSLTSISSRRNSALHTFSFTLVETTSYGPVSIRAFSSSCPTESLRILGSQFWDRLTGKCCILWEIYFLPMAENLFNHLHIIDHMLAQGLRGDAIKAEKITCHGYG